MHLLITIPKTYRAGNFLQDNFKALSEAGDKVFGPQILKSKARKRWLIPVI